MKLYNFTRLIRKYSVTFTLKQKSGSYVYGKWVEGVPKTTEMRGAIVPMKARKVYGSGGTYTTQDRELYLTKPLTGVLSDYSVVYKGNTYAVEESLIFEDYADVAVYALKWVGAEVSEHE